MIKKINPVFEYNEDTLTSLCILTDGKQTFVGTAQCHEDDKDMASEKTGYEIAFKRAKIEYFKHIKNNEIKPALSALKQVYYTMKHSKNFNPKSYENKMLWRQIHSKEFDLDIINKMLDNERKSLITYLKEKDNFYKHIRHNRQAKTI